MNSGIRNIVFFLALIGMSYLAWAYMIKPANAALTAKKIKLQRDIAKLQEFEREKANAENLDKQLQEMEEAVKFFEDKLPHQSQIHEVLTQVTEIVDRYNLKPKTNKTQKVKYNQGYIELPMNMELIGSFNSYYAFLLELEKLDRITKIRELTIKEENKSDGEISAKFIMSIFFQDSKS